MTEVAKLYLKEQNLKLWHVIYTRSRWEKKIHKSLNEQGFETYCPIRTELRQWTDRKVKIEFPLFSSYIFIKSSSTDLELIRRQPGVVNFVYYLSKPATIRDNDMQELQEFINRYQDSSITVSNLKPNDELILKDGILKNQKAIVQKILKHSAILEIPNLGMKIEVKISI